MGISFFEKSIEAVYYTTSSQEWDIRSSDFFDGVFFVILYRSILLYVSMSIEYLS